MTVEMNHIERVRDRKVPPFLFVLPQSLGSFPLSSSFHFVSFVKISVHHRFSAQFPLAFTTSTFHQQFESSISFIYLSFKLINCLILSYLVSVMNVMNSRKSATSTRSHFMKISIRIFKFTLTLPDKFSSKESSTSFQL